MAIRVADQLSESIEPADIPCVVTVNEMVGQQVIGCPYPVVKISQMLASDAVERKDCPSSPFTNAVETIDF